MNDDAKCPHRSVSMNVNGTERTLVCEDRTLLAHALRDQLDLKGVRIGCMNGDCGACSVAIDGDTVKSCLMLAASADGSTVETLEGFSSSGELTDLQQAMWKEDGFQCGFCVAGALFASRELLEEHASPTEDEIREALAGNICRCTGYVHMVKAVQSVVCSRGECASSQES